MNYGFGSRMDILGNRKTTKQVRREVIAQNRQRGRMGEEQVKMEYGLRGYEVERTGRGSDFRVRKRHPFTGRVIESKLIEVKTGNAQTSKLQQKTKKHQSNYKVVRVNPVFF